LKKLQFKEKNLLLKYKLVEEEEDSYDQLFYNVYFINYYINKYDFNLNILINIIKKKI